jgi:hypothetical protein
MGVRDLRAIAKVASLLTENPDMREFIRDAAAAFDIAEPKASRIARRASR